MTAEVDAAGKRTNRSEIFGAWCKVTTTHGVADAYGDDLKYGRKFFFCLIFIMLTIAIFQIYILISAFAAAPHFDSSIIADQEDYMLFPNVTVCNQNRVNVTKLIELGITGEKIHSIEHLFLSQFVGYMFLNLEEGAQEWMRVKEIFDATNRSHLKDPNELLRYLGHSCEETLLHCYMNQEIFDCCSKAEAIINGEYGLCWVVPVPVDISIGEPVQYMPGIRSGLRLRIQPRTDHYYHSIFNNYIEKGVILSVNSNPYLTVYRDPIIIPPGMRARITITKHKTEYIKNTFSLFSPDCTENTTNQIAKGPYNREQCAADCINEFVNNEAECFMVGERRVEGRTCDPEEVVAKIYPKLSSYFSNSTKQTTIIDTSTSAVAFPAPEYLDDITNFYNASKGKANVVKDSIIAEIFYSSRLITSVQIKEKSSIFELFSNIGGQMGVWLGASIVTFVQFVYYFCIWMSQWRK
uniref:Uncharacterized protein n=1 Tax=Plectus sambesii TaxID=2011161 RepID=A0A914V7S0_9BILA